MARNTVELIDRLAADAGPVNRMAPPLSRAVGWLAAVFVLVAVSVWLFADMPEVRERLSDTRVIVEMSGALLTGIVAVIAAFHLSVPGRSNAWIFAPLAPLVLWLSSTGYNCYRHLIVFGPEGWGLGESADCFEFILGTSIPVGVTLLILLRRAFPLAPARVAALGGLGVAALSACALQFFHPFDVTFIDLGVHVVAIGLVMAISSVFGGRAQAAA